ncbi:hypothetical protein SPRG_19764 [Saprolegnia parasitica CBS 223.65]|uniref:Uncharacterized protein n=1 Tax=Saprolegnia parasitica (strain CBS 223.65) TaxID=695850 RepID=A0A067CUM1_SAPPC|nr:hypothetical protein SPRG_19764 [Saprolegnia parasitica CBS 223.65]KDO30201.1 hypothetical protein SPRG_19764 [Saprolegnia parasitica CBS 223.65]|eukprot:XP_012199019.1 hypothetical protein SPRG_19764 [Saprolegnia parasitica CBS 223.65]
MCLNDCSSVIAPNSSSRRTESLQLAHPGTYTISIRCHNHDNNNDRPCTVGIDFNFNTSLMPYAHAEADADHTNLTTPTPTTECPVPDTYRTTGLSLTLRANGTFVEVTGPDKSHNTCSRSGNFSVSGQAALFTVATKTCGRNFRPNEQIWSLFSFSSDCRRLEVNITGSARLLWRPSSADPLMTGAVAFGSTLLAYLAFT